MIKTCDEPERKRSKLCRNCAATIGRWSKFGMRRVMQRKEKLKKWQDRMAHIPEWRKK